MESHQTDSNGESDCDDLPEANINVQVGGEDRRENEYERKYFCNLCKEKLTSKYECGEHRDKFHPEKKNMKIFTKIFERNPCFEEIDKHNINIDKHAHSQHGSRKRTINEHEENVSSKIQKVIEPVIKSDTSNDTCVYKCDRCKVHFVSLKYAINHNTLCRRANTMSSVNCKYCELLFPPNQLNDHTIRDHMNKVSQKLKIVSVSENTETNEREKINIYKCNVCDTHFTDESLLLVHLSRNNHEENTKLCEICEICFCKKSFSIHETHHNVIKNLDRSYFHIVQTKTAVSGRKMSELEKEKTRNISLRNTERYVESISHTEHNGSDEDTEDDQSREESDANEVTDDDEEDDLSDSESDDDETSAKTSKESKDDTKQIISNKYNLYRCIICNIHFEKLNLLLKHISCENHEADVKIPCYYCGLLFDHAYLNKHEKKHKSLNFEDINIVTYDRNGTKVDAPIKQSEQVEPIGQRETELDLKLYKCRVCKVHYNSKRKLIKHLKTNVHDLNVQICDICNLKFTKKYISKHKSSHHEKCKLNGEDFTIIQLKKQAVEKNNPTANKVISVNDQQPDKIKNPRRHSNSDIRDQKNIHRNSLSEDRILYRCAVCDVHYTTERSILRHMSTNKHEMKTKTRCDICQLMFTKQSLTGHKIVHHDELNLYPNKFIIESYGTDGQESRSEATENGKKDKESSTEQNMSNKCQAVQVQIIETGEKSINSLNISSIDCGVQTDDAVVEIREVHKSVNILNKQQRQPQTLPERNTIPTRRKSETVTLNKNRIPRKVMKFYKCKTCEACFFKRSAYSKHNHNNRRLQDYDKTLHRNRQKHHLKKLNKPENQRGGNEPKSFTHNNSFRNIISVNNESKTNEIHSQTPSSIIDLPPAMTDNINTVDNCNLLIVNDRIPNNHNEQHSILKQVQYLTQEAPALRDYTSSDTIRNNDTINNNECQYRDSHGSILENLNIEARVTQTEIGKESQNLPQRNEVLPSAESSSQIIRDVMFNSTYTDFENVEAPPDIRTEIMEQADCDSNTETLVLGNLSDVEEEFENEKDEDKFLEDVAAMENADVTLFTETRKTQITDTVRSTENCHQPENKETMASGPIITKSGLKEVIDHQTETQESRQYIENGSNREGASLEATTSNCRSSFKINELSTDLTVVVKDTNRNITTHDRIDENCSNYNKNSIDRDSPTEVTNRLPNVSNNSLPQLFPTEINESSGSQISVISDDVLINEHCQPIKLSVKPLSKLLKRTSGIILQSHQNVVSKFFDPDLSLSSPAKPIDKIVEPIKHIVITKYGKIQSINPNSKEQNMIATVNELPRTNVEHKRIDACETLSTSQYQATKEKEVIDNEHSMRSIVDELQQDSVISTTSETINLDLNFEDDGTQFISLQEHGSESNEIIHQNTALCAEETNTASKATQIELQRNRYEKTDEKKDNHLIFDEESTLNIALQDNPSENNKTNSVPESNGVTKNGTSTNFLNKLIFDIQEKKMCKEATQIIALQDATNENKELNQFSVCSNVNDNMDRNGNTRNFSNSSNIDNILDITEKNDNLLNFNSPEEATQMILLQDPSTENNDNQIKGNQNKLGRDTHFHNKDTQMIAIQDTAENNISNQFTECSDKKDNMERNGDSTNFNNDTNIDIRDENAHDKIEDNENHVNVNFHVEAIQIVLQDTPTEHSEITQITESSGDKDNTDDIHSKITDTIDIQSENSNSSTATVIVNIEKSEKINTETNKTQGNISIENLPCSDDDDDDVVLVGTIPGVIDVSDDDGEENKSKQDQCCNTNNTHNERRITGTDEEVIERRKKKRKAQSCINDYFNKDVARLIMEMKHDDAPVVRPGPSTSAETCSDIVVDLLDSDEDIQ